MLHNIYLDCVDWLNKLRLKQKKLCLVMCTEDRIGPDFKLDRISILLKKKKN